MRAQAEARRGAGHGARDTAHMSERMRTTTRPAGGGGGGGGARHGVGAPRYGHARSAWTRPVRAGWAVCAHCALDQFLTQYCF